jgi:hypothetical protein
VSLTTTQILLVLVNILHLVLFIVFVWWAYLLHKDLRKGNNGITYSLQRLVLLKDVSSELWSLFVVATLFFGVYLSLESFVLALRLVQLLATIYAVLMFVRAYRKELDVDNNSTQE